MLTAGLLPKDCVALNERSVPYATVTAGVCVAEGGGISDSIIVLESPVVAVEVDGRIDDELRGKLEPSEEVVTSDGIMSELFGLEGKMLGVTEP